MRAIKLDGKSVFVRELMPQDRKIEVEQLTSEEAIEIAGLLAAVQGKDHSRQIDAGTRKQWVGELHHGRSKSLKAPGWLWSSVVKVLADHERGYLDHCRGLEGAKISSPDLLPWSCRRPIGIERRSGSSFRTVCLILYGPPSLVNSAASWRTSRSPRSASLSRDVRRARQRVVVTHVLEPSLDRRGDHCKTVAAADENLRRVPHSGEFDKRVAELLRAPGLLAVIGRPHRLRCALRRVIRDGAVGIPDIADSQQVSEEEAWLDDRNLDAELPDFPRRGERNTFDRELGRTIRAAVFLTNHTGDGAGVNDVAGPLTAHHGQHSAHDVGRRPRSWSRNGARSQRWLAPRSCRGGCSP